MIRIQDIADEVGVSRSLVSKVLSGRMGRSGARPETVRKIRECAEERGYVPNANATALNQHRQNVVGIFLYSHSGQPGSGIIDETVKGVTSVLASSAFRTLLNVYETQEDLAAQLGRVAASQVDGVVVFGDERCRVPEALRGVLARGVPVATKYDEPAEARFPNAGVDQCRLGRLEARHLLERGCRRIVCVRSGEDSPRYRGYAAALAEAGVQADPALVCTTKFFSERPVYGFIRGLVGAKTPFDGVMCGSDAQAASAIRALFDSGIRVPDGVKVAGVDDSALAKNNTIPITSMNGRTFDRAAWATQALLEMVEGKPPRASEYFEPKIAARESTAAARR